MQKAGLFQLSNIAYGSLQVVLFWPACFFFASRLLGLQSFHASVLLALVFLSFLWSFCRSCWPCPLLFNMVASTGAKFHSTLFGPCGFSTGFPSVCFNFCGYVDLFSTPFWISATFRVRPLLFLRRISFFACLSDDFLVGLLFCHFFGEWGLAAFFFCIKFVDDFL